LIYFRNCAFKPKKWKTTFQDESNHIKTFFFPSIVTQSEYSMVLIPFGARRERRVTGYSARFISFFEMISSCNVSGGRLNPSVRQPQARDKKEKGKEDNRMVYGVR
jgi:hypothetical protein